jgi:hypothetical protein
MGKMLKAAKEKIEPVKEYSLEEAVTKVKELFCCVASWQWQERQDTGVCKGRERNRSKRCGS